MGRLSNTVDGPRGGGEDAHRLKRPFALLRIDYVLTRGDLRATSAWTEVVVDSDHLALLADLHLLGTR